MTKQINTTNNKNNGGKSMKKGARVWQFAKSMGITSKKALEILNNMRIKKHHHFCFITQTEFMAAMSAVNNNTIDVQDNKQEQINQRGNTMKTTKRYFIHTERKDDHVNTLAMPYYDDMAAMCGMKDKKIYFGFGEARVSDDVSYFDACAQAYNACREGGVVYLFEYDAPAYGDINVHDFDLWIEYLSEVQSMFCSKTAAKTWYDAIANNTTMVNNDEYNFAGCINQVVFHKDSSVRLVAKIDCDTLQQCRFIYNYFADEYNMAISHDGHKNDNYATISDFTFDEWKQITEFVVANGNGVVISKKSGLAITKDQIATIKSWVIRYVEKAAKEEKARLKTEAERKSAFNPEKELKELLRRKDYLEAEMEVSIDPECEYDQLQYVYSAIELIEAGIYPSDDRVWDNHNLEEDEKPTFFKQWLEEDKQ